MEGVMVEVAETCDETDDDLLVDSTTMRAIIIHIKKCHSQTTTNHRPYHDHKCHSQTRTYSGENVMATKMASNGMKSTERSIK